MCSFLSESACIIVKVVLQYIVADRSNSISRHNYNVNNIYNNDYTNVNEGGEEVDNNNSTDSPNPQNKLDWLFYDISNAI